MILRFASPVALALSLGWGALSPAGANANIAVQEAMWAAFHLEYIDARPIEAFLMVSFYYLIIMVPLSKAVTYLERKKRIPGLGTAEPVRRRWIRPPAPAPRPGPVPRA